MTVVELDAAAKSHSAVVRMRQHDDVIESETVTSLGVDDVIVSMTRSDECFSFTVGADELGGI